MIYSKTQSTIVFILSFKELFDQLKAESTSKTRFFCLSTDGEDASEIIER